MLEFIIKIKIIKIITIVLLRIKSPRILNTIIKNFLKKALSLKKRFIAFSLGLLKKYIKNIK